MVRLVLASRADGLAWQDLVQCHTGREERLIGIRICHTGTGFGVTSLRRSVLSNRTQWSTGGRDHVRLRLSYELVGGTVAGNERRQAWLLPDAIRTLDGKGDLVRRRLDQEDGQRSQR
jgi:hypothetical protein